MQNAVAYFHWPLIWVGAPPAGWPGLDIDPRTFGDTVYRATLGAGISVKVCRDGMFAFDFSGWAPGQAPPEEDGKPVNFDLAASVVLRRTAVLNAHLAYLYTVLDAFSRRVVGWAMSVLLEATLVLDALNMALWNRRPAPGVVHHSDHGAQYTSLAYGRRCQEAGIVPSMGSAGDAYDNALAEAFFATLETELLMRRRFIDRGTARRALFDYIEGWYNPHRRHSALGYLSPAEFERRWWQQPNAAQGTVSTEMESAAGG